MGAAGVDRHPTREGAPPRPVRAGTAAWLAILAVLTTPAAVPGQDAGAEPLPGPGTQLAAGRYASAAVGPLIDFRADDGWTVGPPATGPIFTLERTDQPGAVLTVTRFDGDVFLDSCDPSSLAVVEATVGRLAEVIAGHPFLNPGPPAGIDVDGFRGISLDVATPAYTECRLPYLLIWALPIGDGGEFVQVADQQARFLIIDVEDTVVVVAIEAMPGVPFGGFLEASMALVDSMRIEPDGSLPPALPDPTAAPSAAEVSPAPTSLGNEPRDR